MSDTQPTTNGTTIASLSDTGDVTVIAETRHVDAATTVEQVDPRTLLIEANVRTSVDLDPEFIASVRSLGVLTPVLVHRTADGLRVRAGQRRTLAAIEAGRDTIPALVLDGDEDQVQRIVEQWSENHHRRALSVADDAAAFQQLSLLGLSAAQIAKRTKARRSRVATALAVGGSALASAAAARYDLTLDQAAVIAEFDDDPETVKALTVAAVKEPGRFEHLAQRARDERARAGELAKFVADLTAQGTSVVTDEDTPLVRVLNLTDAEGNVLTDESHATCPGHAARVRVGWDGSPYVAAYGCTDPAQYGHRDALAPTGGPSPAEQDEDAEAKKAARRRVIENNKAWRSAETVRRTWLATFAQRKTAPKDAVTYLANALTSTGTVGDLDRAGHEDRHALARTWLGLPEAPIGNYGFDAAFSDAIAKASPGRAQLIALVVTLAATEARTDVGTWRYATTHVREYFAALARWGYPLSDVEALLVSPTTTPQDDDVDVEGRNSDAPQDDQDA